MRWMPSTLQVWFAVVGGAMAWIVQFVVNLEFTWAKCNHPTGNAGLPVHWWEIGLSIAAIAIGAASMAVSVQMFRRSRGVSALVRESSYHGDHEPRRQGVIGQELEGIGAAPPGGRIAFLSMVGLTVNTLAIIIIIMTAAGAPLLPACQQA
jgi:hypothetical protein